MNYPVWDVAFGAGLLIAVVAVLHVFVSHFAVGGGLFLVLTERKARRQNDAALLNWVKAHTKFFVLVTVVFGAISGVVIQKRNITASPLTIFERKLIILATMWTSPNDNNEINLPISKKLGAPGGCPTSSLYEQEINSPQSQKLAVGSEVRKKMVIAVKPTSQPKTVLMVL